MAAIVKTATPETSSHTVDALDIGDVMITLICGTIKAALSARATNRKLRSPIHTIDDA